LAENRADALKELIPGTTDYYFFHGLHYQTMGEREKFDAVMKQFFKRHGRTVRYQELLNRQALLDVEQDPEASLETIRKTLGLTFDHQRRSEYPDVELPHRLDPKLISEETLKTRAFREHEGLDGFGFAHRGPWSFTLEELNDVRRRELLLRCRDPYFSGLADFIVSELKKKDAPPFADLPVREKLFLKQLDELMEKLPRLRNDPEFVELYIKKLNHKYGAWRHDDPADYIRWLDRLEAFTSTLQPRHNSLKAVVLIERIDFDWDRDVVDEERVIRYLKLPRKAPWVAPGYLKPFPDRERVDPDMTFGSLFPVGNDENLVMNILTHLAGEAEDYTAFRVHETYVHEPWLKRVFASARILHGRGDPETWASMLTPGEYSALRDRVEIRFRRDGRHVGPRDAVELEMEIKNVPELTVKVFELNPWNYYRDHGQPVNFALDLDGMTAAWEERRTYTEPPFRRMSRTFAFPQLKQRGMYIIEFIGNGISSRTLIEKGHLFYLEKITPAGQVITVIDEDHRRLKDTMAWAGGRAFESDEKGDILIPFSTNPTTNNLILRHGSFASSYSWVHREEEYELDAGFHVPREALLAGETATVLVQPFLRLGEEYPVSLKLLEDVRLMIHSTDIDGIESTKEVRDVELREWAETAVDFRVPERLRTLRFALEAKVKNISRNRLDAVSDS
ncbi:MAG: hypothetical protein AAF492_13065, partial [Verrucomicrobiota bacterium]